MKKKWTKLVMKTVDGAKMTPFESSVWIRCVWHEGDRRRDLDNVSAAIKFVLDGLVEMGILKDDSQKYVKGIYHEILTTKDKSYGVEVTIADSTDAWKLY
jgi:Holliday junction resolvase RusA-like endonuclease